MVYTPQVMVSGRDQPDWSSLRAFASRIDNINRTVARARIEITPIARADGGVAAVAIARLAAGARKDDLVLFVAVTQNGLSSRVTAGENKGEKLGHDFVARDLAVARDFDNGTGSVRAQLAFKPGAGWDLERMAVVAFLQNVRTGEVLQALSAPVCRG